MFDAILVEARYRCIAKNDTISKKTTKRVENAIYVIYVAVIYFTFPLELRSPWKDPLEICLRFLLLFLLLFVE